MAEDGLATALKHDGVPRTIAAFPDGSVDTFYRVSAAGSRLDTRDAFANVVATGNPGAVTLDAEAVEPGGHAVNVAEQVDRLGNDVTLAGHLDDPAFDDLPFEAFSMGEPSSISVYGFDDGDLLVVENSRDVMDWTLADLDAALGDAVEDFLTADVVVCTNWTSIDALPDALSALADRDLDGEWFVLDPGSVAGRSGEEVARLFDAVGRLAERYDVVLAGNLREVRTLANAVDGNVDEIDGVDETPDAVADATPDAIVDEALETIRRTAGLAGAVVHAEPWAAAATSEGIVSAENFDVDPVRRTGGGDRFDAGLAHALARGWGWDDVLRLGNACASRYVATGESGSPHELAAFLRDRG